MSHPTPDWRPTATLEALRIRAEVLAYDDLMDAGSHAEARKKGTVRLEGKTYIVCDGDIINFRFNV